MLAGGRYLNRYLALELLAELGAMTPSPAYKSPNSNSSESLTLTDWVLAPKLRVQTPGQVRFISGLGLGLEGSTVSGTLFQDNAVGATTAKTVHGTGAGVVVLGEIGGEVQLKKFFIQGTLFLDVHWVNAVRDNQDRLLFTETSTPRGGLRLLLGYSF